MALFWTVFGFSLAKAVESTFASSRRSTPPLTPPRRSEPPKPATDRLDLIATKYGISRNEMSGLMRSYVADMEASGEPISFQGFEARLLRAQAPSPPPDPPPEALPPELPSLDGLLPPPVETATRRGRNLHKGVRERVNRAGRAVWQALVTVKGRRYSAEFATESAAHAWRNKKKARRRKVGSTLPAMSLSGRMFCPTCKIELVSKSGKNAQYAWCFNRPRCKYRIALR